MRAAEEDRYYTWADWDFPTVAFYCEVCETDYDVEANEVDGSHARVVCPECGDPSWQQVIFD